MTDQTQGSTPLPDAEAVAAYLRAHPEFFVDHDELIPELRIPHQPGTAVSLVERQVKLLRAGSLEEVVSAVEDSLRHEFQVPYVSLILFSEATLPVGRCVSTAEAKQNIGGLLEGGKTICGVLRPHELSFLFGEDGPSVGSAAVVSLDDQLGVLAIGSRDPQHYKSSLGTLFLGYIAEVLARVLPRFGTPLRSVR